MDENIAEVELGSNDPTHLLRRNAGSQITNTNHTVSYTKDHYCQLVASTMARLASSVTTLTTLSLLGTSEYPNGWGRETKPVTKSSSDGMLALPVSSFKGTTSKAHKILYKSLP